MAIYLDSAILEDARRAKEFGWVRGVTTNPTLMSKASERPEVVLSTLAGFGFQQVFYQLVAQTPADMLRETESARRTVAQGLVLKVPPTEAGYRFVADFGDKLSCCVTALFSPAQALVARESGARYVAVYVNRATKQMGDGLALVGEVANILQGSQVEILAASLKSPAEAVAALLAGAQHITVPFEVLSNLRAHPLSAQTLEQFAAEGIGIQLNS